MATEPVLALHLVRDRLGTPFLLLAGPEPDLQWERFIGAVTGLIERSQGWMPMLDTAKAEAIGAEIVAGGRQFHARVRRGLENAGVGLGNPLEFLLALRRIGPKRL